MNEKMINQIGWFASLMGMAMYISYIDQILRNIAGHPGSVILPITTIINCSSWALYGWLRPTKDWPIVICNILGIILGALTAITSVMPIYIW